MESRFRQFVELSPDATIIVDAQGKIVLINSEARKLLGYSSEEIEGQSIERLVPERFRALHSGHRAAFHLAPSRRAMGDRPELPVLRKDGSEFPAEISLNPVETEEGLLVSSVIRDLTPRKQTEAALQSSEERFELAVRGTDLGIWDWDLRTDRVYFSPRWKSMLGYAEDEIRHDFSEWEAHLHPDDRQRALATIRAYVDGQTSQYELEHRLRHKDGSYRWILARGAALRDPTGKPYRMVGSHLDITDRKRTEAELRAREAQLLAAQRIQQHLLPQGPPVLCGFEIAGISFPAEYTGGDYFDFLPMPGGCLGLVIGDVSGHGFGPALLMACTHTLMHILTQTCDNLGDLLSRASAFLAAQTEEGQFVTLFLGRLDPVRRRLTYQSAGHPDAYVFGRDGTVRAVLKSTGLPLAVLPDVKYPAELAVDLEPGDVLLLLTDGILEAASPEGELFGSRRLLDLVCAERSRPAREIATAIRQAVTEFSGRETQDDDITAVIVKVEMPFP